MSPPLKPLNRLRQQLVDIGHHLGPLAESLDDIETLLLKKALARAHGNVAAAARLLGVTRPVSGSVS